MNINFYPRRDDFLDRLFSFLSAKLPLNIEQIIRIRDQVFLVSTDQFSFILKAYSSLSKLALHQDLTAALMREGFNETYSFLKLHEEPLFFEYFYYGCTRFIKENEKPFTFQSQTEREEGLHLLSQFHSASAKLVSDFVSILPKQDLLAKWEERFERFKINLPIVHYYVPKEITSEIVDWGNIALVGMNQFQNWLKKGKSVVLHGDVAHHNFIRDQTGKLFLIDFDLVSVGPESFDLLQYANRILPFMNWSFEELAQYNRLAKLLENKGFLYGLIYPSDIFREWNRVIRQKMYYSPARLEPLIELTIKQFYARKRFIEKVQNLLPY